MYDKVRAGYNLFTGTKDRNLLSDLPSYVTICEVPFTDEKHIQIHKHVTFPLYVYFTHVLQRTHKKNWREIR
jgi:hypothetical protein